MDCLATSGVDCYVIIIGTCFSCRQYFRNWQDNPYFIVKLKCSYFLLPLNNWLVKFTGKLLKLKN